MSLIKSILRKILLILMKLAFGDVEHRLAKRADNYEAAVDKRIEDRLCTHERKVDLMIKRFSEDIVERNDLVLQLFEQTLDKLRREIDAMRLSRSGSGPGEFNPDAGSAPGQGASELAATNGGSSHKQLDSFRRLADLATNVRTKIGSSDKTALYHQILDWKKVAHERLFNFSPDEQEIADYILSFIEEPKYI